MARSWYAYIPGGTGASPALNPANYSLMDVKPNCTSGSIICAVYAPDGGATPTAPFSTNVRRYITNALGAGVPQPSAPINSKLFVYLKS